MGGCSMASSAVAARRSNSLAVTYNAGVSASLATAASSAASSVTTASFTTALSDGAAPTVTDNSPTAAPTVATVVGSAPAGAGLSFLSMAAVAIAVKQLL